jgi:predicted ATPase/DNA-binding CsgD family transcriptional regulator
MTDLATRVGPQAPAAAVVDRGRELGELAELLSRASLVTVTGPAGVGKSRLVQALPAAVDWQAWAVADLVDAPGQAEAQRLLAAAAERLGPGDGPRLLVLDNCDLALGCVARFALALLAEQPALRIVATSRECLGAGGETVYPVRPLAPAQAAAFFVGSAASRHAGQVPEISAEVEDICARLDGLPLAIELAAAHTTVLTFTQIAQRLDDAMHLPASGLRTGPDHHRSLRSALDWGAQTLDPAQRTLLGRLSVFAGTVTLECIEEVCSGERLPEADVLGALAALVAKSWVVCDRSGTQARYRLLRTVRQYADGLLADDPGERDRMQATRVRYAVAHPEDLRPPDLIEALERCAEHDPGADGMGLAVAAAPFLLLAGRLRRGAELLAGRLERADAGADGANGRMYTRLLLAHGMFACALGRCDAALKAAERAAERAEAHGDGAGRGWAQALAAAALLPSDPHGAAHRAASAAAELPAVSPWTAVVLALHALATAETGPPDQARQLAEQALSAARRAPLTPALIAALLAAGAVARRQGRFEAATALLDEAAAQAAQGEATGAKALVLAESGRLALERGSAGDEGTRTVLERALALAAEVDSPLLLADALDVAGRSRLAGGHAPEARGAFAQVTALSQRTVAAQAAAGILGLGEVALAAGSAGAAWTLIEEAHAIARAGAPSDLLARTLHAAGDCARALGDASRAWSAYHQALGVRVESGLRVAAVECLEALAGLAVEQDRIEYGVRLLGASQALRDALGARRHDPAQSRFDAQAAEAMALLPAERYGELYAEGGALSLQEAVAYAGRQRAPRRRGVGWVSLTPAERQVADLAAEGLTNREIGDRLFSSPRTVQAHLSHVFAKLGISSRKMLAAQTQARSRQLPPRVLQDDSEHPAPVRPPAAGGRRRNGSAVPQPRRP